jgi:hypothetical protein
MLTIAMCGTPIEELLDGWNHQLLPHRCLLAPGDDRSIAAARLGLAWLTAIHLSNGIEGLDLTEGTVSRCPVC